MGDLEKFLHNEEFALPHLVRIAIAHYQFETIHPFLDGNGRIGRLLIPLYLVGNGIHGQAVPVSVGLFRAQPGQLLHDALMRVRVSNDLIHWVRFFLAGVAETAANGRNIFQQILMLRTEVEQTVLTLGKRTHNARQLLNLLYRRPILAASEIAQALDVTTPTAHA